MADYEKSVPEFKVDDRVQRASGKGSQGVIKDVREEVTSKGDSSERGLLVVVQWDNGTCSYSTPGALQLV